MHITWPGLLGYDLFISYAHTEASAYAAALERQLDAADLKCFLDVEEAPAGTELESALRAALEKSRILVLVATPSAPDRPWIRREIAIFTSRGAKGTIVPIDVGRSLQDYSEKDPGFGSLQKIVWVAESASALTAGDPSPDVIGSIQKCVDFRRRKVVWRVVARTVGLCVIAVVAVAFVLALKTRQSLAREKTALQESQVALQQRNDALVGEKTALQDRQVALQQKSDALARESRALKDREKALETAVRSSLDAQLLEPSGQPKSPLDILCRDFLENLLARAITARYATAEAEIRRRLSRLPSRDALRAQLPPDSARLAVTVFPSGARIALGYRDRIVIADGTSLHPLYTHQLELPVDKIWLKANPLAGETVYAAVRKEPGETAKIKYYSIAADGSRPIVLEVDSRFGLEHPSHGDNLLDVLVRQFANTKAKTKPPELQLPPEFRWEEHGQVRAEGEHRTPLVVAPDGKAGLWLALDTLTVEKQSRDVAILRFSARPILKTEDGEIADIAAPKFQGHFVSLSYDPRAALPIEPIYEVAALDMDHRVAAVRDRLVSFPKSRAPELNKIPFTLEDAVSAEFNPDATKLLVQHKDGSLDVYDVARQSVTHRFLGVANARCVTLGPFQETAMVVHDDGRLETWDLEAFAPNGWANVTGDVANRN